MARVKKCLAGISLLILAWAAVTYVSADDAALFEDNLSEPEGDAAIVIADPFESDLPTAPPVQPAEIMHPGAAVDLQPREIPETPPNQTEPSASENIPQETEVEEPTPNTQEPISQAEPREETGEELELIKSLLTIPPSVLGQLRDQATSLSDALDGITQPVERQSIAESYWELTEALALYHLALIYASDIEDCISRFTKGENLSPAETAALVSARRLATQRVGKTKIAFTEAQCEFAGARQTSARDQETLRLAIPTDIPNTLPYKTRYDHIKRERNLSPQAALLNETIPTRYEVVMQYDRAAANALEAYRNLYFVGGTSAELLLSAADKLADTKEKFVRAVTAYNKLIAAYVAETVGSDVRGQRLITTMIPLPGHSGIPTWEAPEQIKLAVSPTPTHVSQKSPRPVPAEIPQFDPSTEPEYQTIPRPSQNAEMLR
ncbi:MAG: hypothetical protein ACOX6D_06945 [Thermoguttaceae bacterium]|jgi:hypothetical protein